MIWFTADYHLGHTRIIDYCDRPFTTVKQMNKTIIDNHNSVVAERDTVFFLGDICFSRLDIFWQKLKGNIIWIQGNHDRRIQLPYRIKSLNLKLNGYNMLLTHNADTITDPEDYDLCLVGHSHNTWQFKNGLINVGCDNWNFTPIKFDYMIRRYKKWQRGG